MSSNQLTEYLLWKALKSNKTVPILTNLVEDVNIKEELPIITKQEIFENNMICRVCTFPAEVPITEKIDGIMILTAIRAVASITITETDNYPKYVCNMCLGDLKTAFQFKRKCESSDMMFRRAIPSETVIITDSQPMVMHDFSLVLHQMKQRRAESVWIKNDENSDSEELNNEETQCPFTQSYLEASCPISGKIHSEIKKQKRRTSMSSDTNIHNRIMNILKNSPDINNEDSKGKVDIDVDKHSTRKKDKKLRVRKCKRCELKFDTKEDFQKHRKENSCVYHACPSCGKLVLNLANHERIVHSRTNKYTCHQCGKIYYSSGALTNHMHKHRDTKEYFCEHCPYRGKRKSYLVCHMRVHTGERKYLCSMCPLKFTNPSNLTKHQLVHFNKKFECNKCKRLFREEKVLKEHFDSAHLNIRYRCTICSRDLSSRKKLLRHELRVHKREKHILFEELQRVVIGNDDL